MEPRKLSGLVRGELDWIIMKCLEKDRTRRYETANSLALDIQHYLRDEPVLACPPSLRYRLRKFARRNKRWLTTAALIGLLVVLGLAAAAILLWQEKSRTQAANQRLKENLDLAFQVLDEIYLKVAQQRLPHDDSKRKKEDEELLKKALAFFAEFAQRNNDDPAVRHEVAFAYRRAASIYFVLGQSAEAKGAYRQALAIVERLTAEFPSRPDHRHELAQCYALLADTFATERNWPETKGHLRKALEAVTPLADGYPDRAEYRFTLASAHGELGNALAVDDDREAAEHSYGRALDVAGRLRADYPQEAKYRRLLALLHRGFATALRRQEKCQGAERQLRLAIELLAALTRESQVAGPHEFDNARDLAMCYQLLGWLMIDLGSTAEAERCFAAAVTRLEKLAADYKNVLDYRVLLAISYTHQFWVLAYLGRRSEAEEVWGKAVAVDADYHEVHNHLAWFLATCPDPKLRDPVRALELARKAVAGAPQYTTYWNSLGVALYRTGDWPAAITTLEKSMAVRNDGGDPHDWFFLAMAHCRLGDNQEARKWYDKAVTWMDQSRSKNQEFRLFRAEATKLLGIADRAAPKESVKPHAQTPGR